MAYGLFQFAGAFGFAYVALVEVPAGLGQVILALVPLATLLLAVAQRQERLGARSVLGAVAGVLGVAIISSGALRGSVHAPSVALLLASVLCFGQALVIIRRMPVLDPIAVNTIGAWTGAVVLLGASALAGETWALPERAETWIALCYVAAVGSVVVFLLHVYIGQRWGATRTAHVMLVIPFVTLLLSVWLDDESVGPPLLLGGALILAGVWFGALQAPRPTVSPT